MKEILDHIGLRFPSLAKRWRDFAARWLAQEAALLEPNRALVRNADDILPGLAQAMRACHLGLNELAQGCGLNPHDLRVIVALSRLGELLKAGEITNLPDHELDSRLREAAGEYGLQVNELLAEICNPSIVALKDFFLPTRPKDESFTLLSRLRCWVCSRLRSQCYIVGFDPDILGDAGEQAQVYACALCLPSYLALPKVRRITRVSATDRPISSVARIRYAVLMSALILVCSGLYARAKGTIPHDTWTARLPTKGVNVSLPNAIFRLGSHSSAAIVSTHKSSAVSDSSSFADSSALALAPTKQKIAPGPVVLSSSQIAADPHTPDSARDDSYHSGPPAEDLSTTPAKEVSQVPDPVLSEAKALDHCRHILHSEKPFMRYSLLDASEEGEQNGLLPTDACTRTLNSLATLGSTCSQAYGWFHVFQRTLTNHVKRVCRETAHRNTH